MKVLRLLALVFFVLFLLATPAMAADAPSNGVLSGAAIGAGLGAGLVMMGAAYGFGRIGVAALETMGRQPEVAGKVQIAMIIIAALLEGATFFALLVCLQINSRAGW